MKTCCALAGMIAGILAQHPLGAQTPDQVLVVENRESPVSREIARYYLRKRSVPPSNLCVIDAPSEERIERPVYDKDIQAPIAAFLKRRRFEDKILYIVLTSGALSGTTQLNLAAAASITQGAATVTTPLLSGSSGGAVALTGHAHIDAMIAAVQERLPGYRVRLSSGIEAHHGRVRFSWTAGGTELAPLFLGGTDFAVLAEDGATIPPPDQFRSTVGAGAVETRTASATTVPLASLPRTTRSGPLPERLIGPRSRNVTPPATIRTRAMGATACRNGLRLTVPSRTPTSSSGTPSATRICRARRTTR